MISRAELLKQPGDEDLDRRRTALGELILRRGTIDGVGSVYEILLDGEMLMSSVVNTAEIALARSGLAAWGGAPCRVLVGGLGLGYTVHAALAAPTVESVDVIELLEPVIEWHQTGQVPLGFEMSSDRRVRLIAGDFFAWARGERTTAAPAYDVVLLDIDHSSGFLLQPAHASLYSEQGLRALATRLSSQGVFAYWSSDLHERALADTFRRVFPAVEEHTVEFYNPGRRERDVNTVLVARKAS